MTRTNAIKIIENAIALKGEEKVVCCYYDLFKYRLEQMDAILNEKKFTKKKNDYLHSKLTLKDILQLLSDEKGSNVLKMNIGDLANEKTLGVLIRDIDKNMRWYDVYNHLFGVVLEESYKAFEKYYLDNKEKVDGIK